MVVPVTAPAAAVLAQAAAGDATAAPAPLGAWLADGSVCPVVLYGNND